jgi:hypothetical protein
LYDARIIVTLPSLPDFTSSRAVPSSGELTPWLPTCSTRLFRFTAAMISSPSSTV